MEEKIQLVLASGSPRRQELIKWLYVNYEVVIPDIEEHSDKKNVEEFVMDLAQQKAKAGMKLADANWKRPLVIGSDTIVVVDNKILGKPKDEDDARSMLRSLSGRSHDVYTGVCLLMPEKQQCFYDKTTVTFEDIDDIQLEHYIKTKESLDKAGAYGIQGASLGFIKGIQGSYSNVVGFPLNLLVKELSQFVGAQEWRDYFL
jgi:septum formation protein